MSSILKILKSNIVGERYCIGGGTELSNLQLVYKLYDVFEEIVGEVKERKINFVSDRLGHDFRYAIDNEKFKNKFGEIGSCNFDLQISETVQWYLNSYKFKKN